MRGPGHGEPTALVVVSCLNGPEPAQPASETEQQRYAMGQGRGAKGAKGAEQY